jgi:hypothetical protein
MAKAIIFSAIVLALAHVVSSGVFTVTSGATNAWVVNKFTGTATLCVIHPGDFGVRAQCI